MSRKDKKLLVAATKELQTGSLLTPIKLESIGTNGDPCFGKEYDLSTEECRSCGDSELCCLKTAAVLGKTRQELEQEHSYKDLESRLDKPGIKKYYRKLIREGKSKKEILELMQSKYEVTKQEARSLYREFKNTKNNGQ